MADKMVFSQSVQHLVRNDEPLGGFTWARIGGPAKYFAEPASVAELSQLFTDALEANLPVRIIGDGANVLVRDQGFEGLAISLASAELSKIHSEGNQLVAGAGAKLSQVVAASAGAGLAGIEYLAGIPGTFGGALVCNASVKNGDLGCRVKSVKVITPDSSLVELTSEQLQFGFQRSNLDGNIVVEATLDLQPVDASELTRRMQSAWIVKRASQPISGTRALQAFVEPDGASLQDALESADLRGASEGEVKLSSEHPGYLIVSGNATCEEVIKFIEMVTKKVEALTGTRLQSPVKIW